MNQGFHARENLFFKRGPTGYVNIQKRDDNAWSVTLDADTWASVVASVSARGETRETWEDARSFHMAEPVRLVEGE